MSFQWKQLDGNEKELQKWLLVYKDTGQPVLMIGLSRHGETYQNWKLRRNIKSMYERYYRKVWFQTFKFF